MKTPNKSNPDFVNYKLVIQRKDYSLKFTRSVGKKNDVRQVAKQMRLDMRKIMKGLRDELCDLEAGAKLIKYAKAESKRPNPRIQKEENK